MGFVRALPARYSDDPVTQADRKNLDGVVLQWYALPDSHLGDVSKLFIGKTLVHEVGHWAGLLHTFGFGEAPTGNCTGPGDYVDDTPAQAYSSHGEMAVNVTSFDQCVAVDTCPDQPGLDPIHNFMDYAPEICQNEFTPGQIQRMRTMLQLYRGL